MNIPRMSYPQYRKARRLTHECCNYCNGNCLLLDDGEECVCVQSISYSLLCRWFKVAVLPLDAALCAEITKGRDEIKRCAVCGAAFTPNSNRAKYCPDCAVQVRRKKEAERQRKRYLLSTHLVVEVAQVFKDGGLGVRLRQLVADVRKLNALGKGAGRYPAYAVLIHGLIGNTGLCRMGLAVALILSDDGLNLFLFGAGELDRRFCARFVLLLFGQWR